jgi:hypothetical protein
MNVSWLDDRCILCLRRGNLALEHVIPRSIGGILTSKFLCKICNERCGHTFESDAKRDPSIRLAAMRVADQAPVLLDSIENGQEYIADVGPERRVGWLKNGKVLGIEGKLADGSLMKMEENAPSALTTLLRRQGENSKTIEKTISIFQQSEYSENVPLNASISIKKWKDQSAMPRLSGKMINPLVLLKISCEFAAIIKQIGILENSKPLN